MAFLQIKSTNPKLSFILRKNPATGMIVRHLKEGHLIGYYSNDNTVFNCYFKDADYDVSYKIHRNEDFEYINTTRYHACEFVLDTINEFLSHIIKKDIPDDVDGFENEVFLNLVYVRQRYLEIFSKYYTDYEIKYEKITEGNFRVWFKTKKSLKELISFVQLFSIFNVLKNRVLNDSEIEKYINVMDATKTPYFVKYVFKVNMLRDVRSFDKYKDKLAQNCVEDVEFSHGYLAQQRFDYVKANLDYKRDIVDFGCGEGNFIWKFRDKIENVRYYAVDKDEEVREGLAKRFPNKENLAILEVFPELNKPTDVIMSEVVEHMDLKDAEFTLNQILMNPCVGRVIITTPDKDFNQFYFFDEDETRHEDHHFELTSSEFRAWIEKVTNNKFNAYFTGIGDKVNGIHPSLGCVISKKV